MRKYMLALIVVFTCLFAFAQFAGAAVVSKQYSSIKPRVASLDSDGDGLYDWIEKKLGTNPRRKDTDRDGLSDGFEDMNRNGIHEPFLGETNPLLFDSDYDGLSDSIEVANPLSPLHWDTDGDGIGDAYDRCPTDVTDTCDVIFEVEEVVIVFDDAVYISVPDWDGDGVEDAIDPCPFDFFDRCIDVGIVVIEEEVVVEVVDSDGDGAEDAYDPCPLDYFDTCFADEVIQVEEVEEIVIVE